MNGYEAAASQAQQRSVSGSKSWEEALEEGNSALYKDDSTLRGGRPGGNGEAGMAVAGADGPRPRIGVNAESEVCGYVGVLS